MKKIIIAGSRSIELDAEAVESMLLVTLLPKTELGDKYKFKDVEWVSGGARGVDASCKKFTEWYKFKYKEFPADWDKYGKSAGHIRNKQMADYADVLLLIWDGESKGSANMKMNMEKLRKPVYEVIIKNPVITKLLYGPT